MRDLNNLKLEELTEEEKEYLIENRLETNIVFICLYCLELTSLDYFIGEREMCADCEEHQ